MRWIMMASFMAKPKWIFPANITLIGDVSLSESHFRGIVTLLIFAYSDSPI